MSVCPRLTAVCVCVCVSVCSASKYRHVFADNPKTDETYQVRVRMYLLLLCVEERQ